MLVYIDFRLVVCYKKYGSLDLHAEITNSTSGRLKHIVQCFASKIISCADAGEFI